MIIVKAVNEAKLTSMYCFIHALQLIVHGAIKVQPKMFKMISCARKIV